MNYGIELSPKEGRCEYKGLNVRWFNQSNAEWTHPYVYDNPNSTLRSSGCDLPPVCSWENIRAFYESVNHFYSERN